MAKKKQQLDTWAPAFGLWMETATVRPPAASTFLGMWQMDGAAVRLRDCCCYYYDADGKRVDPDEKEYTAVHYWQWEGDLLVELPPPVMWCETRWAIPVGKAWDRAHGLG